MRGRTISPLLMVLFLPTMAAAAPPSPSDDGVPAVAPPGVAAEPLPTVRPGEVVTQGPWRPPAERSSFTWELGVGAGVTSVGGDDGSTHSGFAPSLGLGGFVTSRLALMARISATTYTEKAGYAFQAFYGGAAQLWPIDRLFVSGGVGVATLTPPSVKSDMSVGLGGSVRAGFVVAPLPRLDVAVVVEAMPAVYGDRFVMGASLGIEFQHI